MHPSALQVEAESEGAIELGGSASGARVARIAGGAARQRAERAGRQLAARCRIMAAAIRGVVRELTTQSRRVTPRRADL